MRAGRILVTFDPLFIVAGRRMNEVRRAPVLAAVRGAVDSDAEGLKWTWRRRKRQCGEIAIPGGIPRDCRVGYSRPDPIGAGIRQQREWRPFRPTLPTIKTKIGGPPKNGRHASVEPPLIAPNASRIL